MEWIKVSERLPEAGERVLLFTSFAVRTESRMITGSLANINGLRKHVGGEVVPVYSHWMPLPEPPETAGTRGPA